MGRNRHRRGKRSRPENFDQSQKDKFTQKSREQGEWYNYAKLENANFVKYYKGQGFVKAEEWDDFLKVLKTSLPVTFRVTGCRSEAQELLKIIKGQYFSNLSCVEIEGKSIEPPKCLPWYPDEMAWQINLSRKEVRRYDVSKKLHEFMISETASGNINRQEGVSMIPPLLLDVKPHHKVLDMCAAPGSKTAQLIEYLHSDESVTVPEGFVVANDRDNKRCYLMVHQVKRIQSPNVVIVNHDATLLPNLRLSDPDEKPCFVQYDRVLADVPCSGDGTMRKNQDVWRKWSPNNGVNLHDLQFRILKRGLELLSIGGRLVYSTCSFNPVENEAVVGTMLQKCEGTVKLLDVSKNLPGLKFINGLTSWKIMSNKGEWISSFDVLSKQQQNQFKKTIFPLPKEELDAVNIQRCVRILPHHQNTGGFFIAVMEKTAELPWKKLVSQENSNQTNTAADDIENGTISSTHLPKKSEDEKTVAEQPETKTLNDENLKKRPDSTENMENPPPKKPKMGDSAKETQMANKTDKSKGKNEMFGYKEDPFIFFDRSDVLWSSLQKFYEIPDSFPVNQLMYRCETGAKRNLYFVSKEVRRIAVCNKDRVKFINMGVKALSRSPSPLVPDCDFRIAQEGLNAMHNYLPGRRLQVFKDDVTNLLKEENPLVETFNEKTIQELIKLSPGSTIFFFKPSESDPVPNCDIVMCGWRGKTSIRSFIKQNERFHYLRLCGVDPYEIMQKEKQMKAKLQELKDKSKIKGNIHMSSKEITNEEENMLEIKEKEMPDSDKESESDNDVEPVLSEQQDDPGNSSDCKDEGNIDESPVSLSCVDTETPLDST